MFNRITKLTLAGMMLLSLTFIGCSDDDDDPIMGNTTSTANVLIVHASPDAPGVDILVDNAAPAVSNLEFPANTGYVPLPIGMPLILIGAPIVMRHSLKGRRLILKTVRRFPVLERGLNRTRRNGPP